MKLHTILSESIRDFQQKLLEFSGELESNGLNPERFQGLVRFLQDETQAFGRGLIKDYVEAFDLDVESIELPDQPILRFKDTSEKEWLTPFGLVNLERRLYQADRGGKCLIPIDSACGMTGAFMTPDIEEMAAYSAGLLTPGETEKLLGKILPHAPSKTTVEDVAKRVGQWFEEHQEALDAECSLDCEKTLEADALVISWDGVTVPLREKGKMQGRPAERPGIRDSVDSPSKSGEAGVATISYYRLSTEEEVLPERLKSTYFGRMPESEMKSLVHQLIENTKLTLDAHPGCMRVVICDGKPAIWQVINHTPFFEDFIKILDFYHAAEKLSKTAEALFGKSSKKGSQWYKKYRSVLKEMENGVQQLMLSIKYYRKKKQLSKEADDEVRRALNYFHIHQKHMQYRAFRDQGLPIGSGPVEAGCKNVVGARFKRSGMRWSRVGGQKILNIRTRILSGHWDIAYGQYRSLQRNVA